jgi:hypothetical protein
MNNFNIWRALNKNRILALTIALASCRILYGAGVTPGSELADPRPSVSIAPSNISEMSIRAPRDGATVSGSLTVSVNVRASEPITGVQIQVDDSNLGKELLSTPYSTVWDTSALTNGNHTLRFVARDAMGSLTASTPVIVNVHNDAETVVQVTPSSDWCTKINSVSPGTTVVMAAGVYTSPCAIRNSGTSSSPIVIRSVTSQPARSAVLAYAGNSANVFDVYGAYLEFEWLSFVNTQQYVDAIKIRSGHNITVLENTFENLGGTAVVYNDPGTVDRISVVGNTIQRSKFTAIYLGCHDGTKCHATNVLVEGNLINGVHPGSSEVGYGMEIKLNSFGTVVNNTVYDTRGPCIEVYGSNQGDPATLVEGNYVQGSMTDAGINISGGPAMVYNNVSVGNAYGGIYAQDYQNRGLQKNVWITFNTVLANQMAGILVQHWTAENENVLADNAIATLSSEPPMEPSSPEGTILTNVKCNPATSCFDQPTSSPYDLWPLSAGPLIGAGGKGLQPWRPEYDFMGIPRGEAADIGAFQRTGSGKGPSLGGGKARPVDDSGVLGQTSQAATFSVNAPASAPDHSNFTVAVAANSGLAEATRPPRSMRSGREFLALGELRVTGSY